MQGYPLTMTTYMISILPLINNLKREITNFTHTWYSDDAGALGTFAIPETFFDLLTHQVPGQGYHPETSKRVLIVRPENIDSGKLFGARHLLKVCTGARYIGGYIRENKSKHDWMRERTLTREKNTSTISKTTGKYTQESYAVVVRAIQS